MIKHDLLNKNGNSTDLLFEYLEWVKDNASALF